MRRPDAAMLLAAQPVAHRGLHRPDGPSENGLPAFAAALDGGYGMECDVRLSRDGRAMVFHDATLDRMTGAPGRVDAHTAGELAKLRLPDGSGVPTLAQLLALVAGKAALLIELKVDAARDLAPLCATVAGDLNGYVGPVGVMSFHPGVGRWFARHNPALLRGLVVRERAGRTPYHFMRRTLDLGQARPDFLAYDIASLPSPTAQRFRRRGMPVLSWTVRTDDERARAALYADAVIFEDGANHG